MSGLLLTAGFPKPAMFYLSWVALVPLLFAVRGKTGREAFFLGYACGFAHFVTVLFWIRHAVYHYGGFSHITAFLVLVLLCTILALYPALFALAARTWESSPLLSVFGLPFVWVSLEWIRAHALSGFPWANLGYTQTPLFQMIQVADITGVYGLSWLVVFANTVVFGFFQNRFRKTAPAVLLVLAVAALAYGSWRVKDVRGAQEKAAPFQVAIVQGNVEQGVKWDPGYLQETLNRYERLSLEAAGKNPPPDLLFWPESAMPFFYGINEEPSLQVNKIVNKAGKPVLFGSTGVTLVDGKARLLNRAYLLDETATLKGAYAKQHLVPFGEYVPFSKVLFFVQHLVAEQFDFVPGKSPGPVLWNGPPLGVLVCYEVIFPEISRETVRRGAEVLMNMTNDAWYGDTGGPYQHLEIARWRAIEFRVPLVRAANTGVSALFDATGTRCEELALNSEGVLPCAVRPLRYLSFYARFGDVFAWLSVSAVLSGFLYLYFYRRKTRRKSQ